MLTHVILFFQTYCLPLKRKVKLYLNTFMLTQVIPFFQTYCLSLFHLYEKKETAVKCIILACLRPFFYTKTCCTLIPNAWPNAECDNYRHNNIEHEHLMICQNFRLTYD